MQEKIILDALLKELDLKKKKKRQQINDNHIIKMVYTENHVN